MKRALACVWMTLGLLACATGTAAQGLTPAPGHPLPAWIRPLPLPSVLRLGTDHGSCSAVAVAPTLALTAAHCLPPEVTGAVLLSLDGSKHEVVSYSTLAKSGVDAAVMRVLVPFTSWATVTFKPPNLGDLVFVSGYGCFNALDVRAATYLGEDADKTTAMNGTVCHGDSGGPVFNDEGQVIGLIKATVTEHIPAAWATPTTRVRALLP